MSKILSAQMNDLLWFALVSVLVSKQISELEKLQVLLSYHAEGLFYVP